MTKITKETMLSALQKNFPEITDIIRNKGYKIQDTEYPPNITVYFTSSMKKKEHTWNYSITFSLSNNSIPYDTEDQEKIIKELPQLIKDETEKHTEFLKTPAGKKQLLDEKVIQFANDTAIKHVRSGRITHDKNQHPDIEVPDSWHRIIIARRAQKGMRGTKD